MFAKHRLAELDARERIIENTIRRLKREIWNWDVALASIRTERLHLERGRNDFQAAIQESVQTRPAPVPVGELSVSPCARRGEDQAPVSDDKGKRED